MTSPPTKFVIPGEVGSEPDLRQTLLKMAEMAEAAATLPAELRISTCGLGCISHWKRPAPERPA
jgi:hypothetical protein